MTDDSISRQAAIDALDGEITVTGSANAEAVRGYVRLVADRLKRLPSAQPEHLHIVMEKLNKQYEKAINNPFVIKPMAWALYQVWKEYDR